MRIVCVISPYYDYLTATLMEGLQELGHEIVSSEHSNYTQRTSNRQLRDLSENADLIIVGSNRKVRTWLVEDIDNPHKVFIDGSDQQGFNVYPHIPFKAVFKRELNQKWINTTEEPIYPLPFAAEKRYFVNRADKRDIRVTFAANMNTNTMRNSVYQRLKNKNDPGIFCGTTGEGAYRTQNCLGMPTETPKFRRLLSQTQIGINVAGAGYDCARYWEILAACALLMTQELDIIIPHPFTDGVNCVVFKSLDEFDAKLDQLLSNPAAISEMAEAGYQHLLRYHTTAARASYFLNIATATNSEVFCKSFYSGPQKYHFKKKVLILIKRIL
ncbi:glycosyltransferase family 1 protein [bacterium]|nr:glycosyltransferase family 1 protein [bacterium]